MARNRWLSILLVLFSLIFVIHAQDNGSTQAIDTIGFLDDETPFERIALTLEDDITDIAIEMTAVDGTLDTLVYLLDPQGRILSQNDDSPAGGTTDSLLRFVSAPAGEYEIIATRYNVGNGNTSGTFNLNVRLESAEDSTLTFDVSDEALAQLGLPEIETRSPAAWTVIAYYGADTNLEEGILIDFNEFERAGGSSDDVRVVALLDRHPGYSEASENWFGARVYEVGSNQNEDLTFIDSEPLAILDNLDTGEGEVFARFLTWALRHFPAERYAVAFASHGAGWRGIITDETGVKTQLTLPELRQAFDLAIASTEIEGFDVLINDACLMSSVEYHDLMANYFSVSFASPEVVYNPALDMTIFAEALQQQTTSVDLASLGTTLVDTYIERDLAIIADSVTPYLTNAVIDLNAMDSLRRAIDAFATLVSANISTYAAIIGEARNNTYTYTAFAQRDDLIDLGDFMTRVIESSEDEVLIAAAANVQLALSNALIHGNAGDRAGTSTYQNIYFPPDSRDFQDTYLTESQFSAWGNMLRAYYNTLTPSVWAVGADEVAFHPPKAPVVELFNVFPSGTVTAATTVSLGVEIVGRNIATAELTYDLLQDDGTSVRLGRELLQRPVTTEDGRVELLNIWESGVNTTRLIWFVDLPVFSDGVNENFEYFVVADEVASLRGRYRTSADEDWTDVRLTFDVESGDLAQVVAQNEETNSVAIVEIPAGAAFQTFRQVVTADGRLVPELGNVYVWPEASPTYETQLAPSGTYNVGAFVASFGGATGFTSTVVEVDNSEVPTNIRSTVEAELGVAPVRPAEFTPLVSSFEDRWLVSFSDDGSLSQRVFLDFGVPNDLEAIIQGIAEFYAIIPAEDREMVELASGKQGLVFDYTREGIPGRGIAAYADSAFAPRGLVLAMEIEDSSAEGVEERFEEAFALMRDESYVFDVFEFENNQPDWITFLTLSDADSEVFYNILDSWLVGESLDENDPWVRHGSGNDLMGANRAALRVIESPLPNADAQVLALYRNQIIDVAERYTDEAVLDTRLYIGENHDWDTLVYSATRQDGTEVNGRFYLTYANDRAYAAWFELDATDPDALADTVANIAEPFIDGIFIELTTEEVAAR